MDTKNDNTYHDSFRTSLGEVVTSTRILCKEFWRAHALDWSSLKRFADTAWARSAYIWLFIVPIAAKALSSVPETIHVPIVDKTIELHLGLPFSWVLFYLGAIFFSIARLIFSISCPPLIRDFDRYADYADVGRGGDYILEQYVDTTRLSSGFESKPIEDSTLYLPRLEAMNYVSDLAEFLTKYTSGHQIRNIFPIAFARDYGKETNLFAFDPVPVGVKHHSKRFLLESPFENEVREDLDYNFSGPLKVEPDMVDQAYWHARNHSEQAKLPQRAICTDLYYVGFAVFGYVTLQSFVAVLRIILS